MWSTIRHVAARRLRSGSTTPLDEGEPCAALDEDVDRCLEAAPGPFGGALDVTALDEEERLAVLAGLTARFSAAYLRWMRSRFGDLVAFSGVRVLELLAANGSAIMRDLAANLGVTARNMTAIVDSLEGAGLVQRVPHAQDRRATVIELTSAGRREATQARRQALARAAQAFSHMSVEEQQTYVELLSRLATVLCG
jgi:DNA-binding MarR family transcriptional regulator